MLGKDSSRSRAFGRTGEPRVLVIAPCRGRDLGLRENLLSIKSQSYGNFDMVCVIDSTSDPALAIIEGAGIRYLISNPRIGKGSGKVKAIATAIRTFKHYDIYVIADSDIHVKSCWLGSLVSSLLDRGVGLSTSFPYFVSADKRLWSKFKSAWGLVGLGLIKSEITRFGWGGSLAFRKSLISNKEDFSYFKDSLSDDIALTRITKRKGLGIAYNGKCSPRVYCSESFATFFEWSNRQTALSILGNRKVFWFGVIYYTVELLFLILGVSLFFLSPLFLVLALLYTANVYRSYRSLAEPSLSFFPILFVMPFYYLANLFIAKRMRSIEWRGRRYDLK